MTVNVWVVLRSEQDCSSEVMGVFVNPKEAEAFELEVDRKVGPHYFADVQGPFELDLPIAPVEELQ